MHVRTWWDFIDDKVIVGARPFAQDVLVLHQAGVRAVVNTCHETAGPLDQYTQMGIEQLHIPTVDFTHPSLADVTAAVAFVDRHVQAGHVVYIHCKAGRARSATVAICWLIAHRGMTPDDAQALLLARRPHINPRVKSRPVVRQFVDRLATRRTRRTS